MTGDLEAWLDTTEGARLTLDALGELGGEATPGDVGERSGVAKSSRTKWLGQLRGRGLVEGPKGRVRLTPRGRSLANRSAPVAGVGAPLDEALRAWPTAWHQAALRLAVSAVVARHHLAGVPRYDGHFPGVVVVGPTGSGKSEMARFVLASFGLDRVAHTLWLPQQSSGSVFGRREIVEGGGRAFVPAPWLGRPFVLFEEADKAPREVRARVLAYFQGNVEALEEGERLQLRPTPFLVANTERAGLATSLVPGEYCRRSIVVDLWHVASMVDDLGERLEALYASGGPTRLRLEDLAPPAEQLDDETRATFTSRDVGIRRVMTEAGWAQCDRVGLEVMALGRAGLLGLQPGEDLRGAVIETAADYLTVAETLPGQLVGGAFTLDVAAWRAAVTNGAGLDELERHMAELYAQREQVAEATKARRQVRQVEEVELIEARGALSEELRQAELAIRQVPAGLKPEAAGLRDALRKLRERVENSKRRDGLEELAHLAAGPLQRARALRAGLDQAKDDAERERAAAAAQIQRAREEQRRQERAAVEQRKFDRARQAQLRQGAGDQLAGVREIAKKLEALYRRARTRADESPLDVLAGVELPGGYRLLWYESPAPVPGLRPDAGFFEKLGHRFAQPGPGTWHTLDPALNFSGYLRSCDRLAAWGPDTRRVLAPALAGLYVIEDRLEHLSRKKPRAKRLALPTGTRVPELSPARQALTAGW